MTEITERLERLERALTAPSREYLPVAEAAEFLCLSRQQLDVWRMNGDGPAYHRVGRRILYSLADLRTFMDAHRAEPLS